MANPTLLARWGVLATLILLTGPAFSQSELRATFFRDADAALAEANKANAQLLAPTSYAAGMKDYQAAEAALERGRNVAYVRHKAADAAKEFQEAARVAGLGNTVLAQVMKSRQAAPNP